MAISVESRKRLWGRSGGKCAICKENLFEMEMGYDTIVGEEAHIIARSPGGPRREFLTEVTKIDDYSNLILLCPRDHTIVDTQPARWTVERLRDVKAVHEDWVQNLPPEERPVKLIAGRDYWTKNFYPLADGSSLWQVVAMAHSYKFDHPADCSADELDYLAELFDAIKDWGEIASFMNGRVEERDAEHSLDGSIKEAMERSFVLMGRRVEMIMTGGIGPDSSWQQAEVQVWRPDQLLEALAAQSDDE
jgi:hypothetical protein